MYPFISRKRAAEEHGLALLVTVMLLLLISAIGLTALNHAQSENMVAGSSRRKLTTLYAADALLNVVASQLANPTVSGPAIVPVDRPQFLPVYSNVDASGGGGTTGLFTSARTGTIDNMAPQPIDRIGTADPGDGEDIRVGAGAPIARGVYRVSVVANEPGGGNVQLQAQYVVLEGPGY